MANQNIRHSDDDIKIYNCGHKNNITNNENLDLDDFLFQRSSGNLKTARLLGNLLGKSIAEVSKRMNQKSSKNLPKIFIKNRQVLLWFSFMSSLESSINNEYLLSVAKESANNTIKQTDYNLYKNINCSLASSLFIFYKRSYHCINSYGKCFAQLCQKNGDKSLTRLGIILYIIFFNIAKNKIKQYQFS